MNDSAPRSLDADFFGFCQRMPRVNDQGQLIPVEHVRRQIAVLGAERDDSELDVVVEHLAGNLAGQGTHDLDADHGMHAMKHVQYRKQVTRREFVGGNDQFALVQHA